MDKVIRIDGRDVKFRATARSPRLYRGLIGRDMVSDMNKLSKSSKKIKDAKDKGEDVSFTQYELTIFEDVAYVMAKHADPTIPETTADEWLDTFEMFSIWEILPELLALWGENQRTTSTPKKN